MKKQPIYYDNQIIGYIDNVSKNEGDIIIYAKIFLFKCNLYDEIINNINKSEYVELHKGIKYNFQLKNDTLICKIK